MEYFDAFGRYIRASVVDADSHAASSSVDLEQEGLNP